jgi:hypothetical protein
VFVPAPPSTETAVVPPPPPPPSAPRAAKPAPPDQATLVAEALDAMTRGDAAAALVLIERDATLHSRGTLVEEREALRIEALLDLGRAADARTFAAAFTARFPDSPHRPLAERALEEAP